MYPYDPNAPPAAPRKRHHYIRWTLAGLGALILLIVVIGVAGGSGTKNGTTAIPHQSTSAPATQAPAPAVPAVATPTPNPVTTVTFTVTGWGDPSITYGSDSDNRDGGGTLGQLGDGNALPWTRSLPFSGDASYYSVNAQLEGAGDISCKIVVSGPGDNPATVSSGHASGGYSICAAQAAPSDSTGLSWQNER